VRLVQTATLARFGKRRTAAAARPTPSTHGWARRSRTPRTSGARSASPTPTPSARCRESPAFTAAPTC
jgi:hypothetical protein